MYRLNWICSKFLLSFQELGREREGVEEKTTEGPWLCDYQTITLS